MLYRIFPFLFAWEFTFFYFQEEQKLHILSEQGVPPCPLADISDFLGNPLLDVGPCRGLEDDGNRNVIGHCVDL